MDQASDSSAIKLAISQETEEQEELGASNEAILTISKLIAQKAVADQGETDHLAAATETESTQEDQELLQEVTIKGKDQEVEDAEAQTEGGL